LPPSRDGSRLAPRGLFFKRRWRRFPRVAPWANFVCSLREWAGLCLTGQKTDCCEGKHPSGVKTPSFSCAYLARLKPCPFYKALQDGVWRALSGRGLRRVVCFSRKGWGWVPRVAPWAIFGCPLRERVRNAAGGARFVFQKNGGDGFPWVAPWAIFACSLWERVGVCLTGK
jgi:hypothetical protein